MLMASTMNVSVSAIAVAGLVGLGVGVDYALFVVARYRENRSAGQDNARALSNAMATQAQRSSSRVGPSCSPRRPWASRAWAS